MSREHTDLVALRKGQVERLSEATGLPHEVIDDLLGAGFTHLQVHTLARVFVAKHTGDKTNG